MQLKVQFSHKKVENIIKDLNYSNCVVLEYDTNEKHFYYDEANKVYKLKLKPSSSIINAITLIDNIYFLIDADEDTILYVGKSAAKDINSRLTEHLLKNENSEGKKSGTASKIKEVYNYLNNRVNDGKEAKIRYYTFEVYPEKLNAAVEGHLISYLKSINKKAEWNLRNG